MSQVLAENKTISDENMPNPAGWRILVKPIDVEELSKGGIVMPASVIEAQEHLRNVAQVVAMGPLCYKHAKFGDTGPWCKVGDWVIVGEYAGQSLQVRNTDGGMTTLKFLSDDEIRGTIDNPKSVLNYV